MSKIFAGIAFLILFAMNVASSTPVNNHGQLRVEGAHIIDCNGQKVALKGISLGWHNWWPQYYNASVVDFLSRSWRLSVIRVAMGVEPEGGYLKSPEQSEVLVKTVIDAAIANGIYVIADWHSHDIYTEQAEIFFTNIAQQYAGQPHIIYEIYNEPVNNSWHEIRKYSIRIIEAIRKYDRHNVIIVGTPNWSQDVDIVADDPVFGYDNLVYSLHFYAASHKDNIRRKAEYAINRGLPLFVSECSPSFADGNGKLDKKEFAKWLKLLKQNDISFVLWGLFDKDESSAMLRSGANPYGKWPTGQLTQMGFYSRQIIGGRIGYAGIVFTASAIFIAAIACVWIIKRIRVR